MTFFSLQLKVNLVILLLLLLLGADGRGERTLPYSALLGTSAHVCL